jgi:hypothetical protein
MYFTVKDALEAPTVKVPLTSLVLVTDDSDGIVTSIRAVFPLLECRIRETVAAVPPMLTVGTLLDRTMFEVYSVRVLPGVTALGTTFRTESCDEVKVKVWLAWLAACLVFLTDIVTTPPALSTAGVST